MNKWVLALLIVGMVVVARIQWGHAGEPEPAPSPPPCGCVCNADHTQCACEICPGEEGSELWVKHGK